MKHSEEMLRNFWGFLVETFEFTEEQTNAIDKQTEMTQEIYNSILDRCTEIGPDADNLFYRMLTEYPALLEVYAERIEKDLEDFEMPELSDFDTQLSYEKLCERIRAEYGPDAI